MDQGLAVLGVAGRHLARLAASRRSDVLRRNVNLGVSVNGFPLSLSGSQCETWDITKYARAGEFRNKWTEGLCQTERGERELKFTVAVRVAQGKVPTWSFDWFEHVQLASCAV